MSQHLDFRCIFNRRLSLWLACIRVFPSCSFLSLSLVQDLRRSVEIMYCVGDDRVKKGSDCEAPPRWPAVWCVWLLGFWQLMLAFSPLVMHAEDLLKPGYASHGELSPENTAERARRRQGVEREEERESHMPALFGCSVRTRAANSCREKYIHVSSYIWLMEAFISSGGQDLSSLMKGLVYCPNGLLCTAICHIWNFSGKLLFMGSFRKKIIKMNIVIVYIVQLTSYIWLNSYICSISISFKLSSV